MGQTAYDWLPKALDSLHRAHWYRQVQPVDGRAGPVVTLDGQRVLNFASNDYLGLAADPRLAAAAIQAIQTYGTGSTGSRLLSGHRLLHQALEAAIATLKQTEAALVFSSGYLANLGTLAALAGPRDLIVGDRYNHASLKNGAVLSGATVMEYAHSDPADLQRLLAAHRHRYRRCLIVTDSVFSMDGDLCPLPQILDLADAFEAMVLVDEAHGTGVMGPTGGGVVEAQGCSGRPLIQIGTLSKALGSLGGYVAGSQALIEFLSNRASTWIYTTGLSPADTAAAKVAIALVQQEPERRQRLHQHADWLRQQIDQLLVDAAAPTYKRLPSASPILCIQVKDAKTVLTLGQHLRQQGIFASAVRPPTVPTSRLRLTVMATHRPEHLEQLIAALRAAIKAEP